MAPRVRALLLTDVDEQRSTPLAVLRYVVAHPTAVLRRAGVPPVRRDAEAERHFPDDDYDLAIASYADLDPAVGGARPGVGGRERCTSTWRGGGPRGVVELRRR